MALMFWILAVGCNAFGGGFVIGNGGEGFEINDTLYLRDLVEAGVEKFPYIGPKIDPGIEARLRFLPIDQFSLPFSKDLLARKLTDLEQAHSGLGHYIFEAIKSYTWLGVNAPLASIPDPEEVLEQPGPHVQIANRDDSTIRIHIGSWKRLSDEHKIALIIHEAVYSLLKPICDMDSVCYQPARRARSITGLLFFDFFFAGRSSIAVRVLPYIDVPKQLPHSIKTPRNWTLKWYEVDSKKLHTTVLQLPMPYAEFEKEVGKACRVMSDANTDSVGQNILSALDLRPYTTRTVQYRTTYTSADGSAIVGYQMRLSIQPRLTNLKHYIIYGTQFDESKCRSAFFAHYQMALDQD